MAGVQLQAAAHARRCTQVRRLDAVMLCAPPATRRPAVRPLTRSSSDRHPRSQATHLAGLARPLAADARRPAGRRAAAHAVEARPRRLPKHGERLAPPS
eukprot:7381575-Prymnesium_polylepis.1